MAKTSITFLFWLFKSKKNRKDQYPIMLRLTYQSKRWNFCTGLCCNLADWDQKQQKFYKKTAENKEKAKYLSSVILKIQLLQNDLHQQHDIVTLDQIKATYHGKVNNGINTTGPLCSRCIFNNYFKKFQLTAFSFIAK